MIGFSWFLVFLLVFFVLAYQRASLIIWTISFTLLLILASKFNGFTFSIAFSWIFLIAIFAPLYATKWRRHFITQPILRFYQNIMPTMSRTEREAISAGTITWEGDLF